MNVNINDNSINILNHTITIDDMLDDLYYRTNISLAKNDIALKLLYLNNINDYERNNFYYLINTKISDESKQANLKNPIFKFIDIKNQDFNQEFYLDIENYTNKNHLIEYKLNNNTTYKIKIYQTEYDKYKFNNIDWNWHITYLDPFYSTLKFKIKEEKITRKIRNDLDKYKTITDNNYNNLSNKLETLKTFVYKNDINIKYYIAILYLILIIDFLLYLLYYNGANKCKY